jgi:hypothetical protein
MARHAASRLLGACLLHGPALTGPLSGASGRCRTRRFTPRRSAARGAFFLGPAPGFRLCPCRRWQRRQPRLFRINAGQFPPNQLFDSRYDKPILFIGKTNRGAGCTGATRSTNAMDIIFRIPGEGVVDNMVHTLDVDPPAGDIGGHQHPDFTGLEIFKCPYPGLLADIA